MNACLSAYSLHGATVDIGGGHKPDYFNYFKSEPDFTLLVLDGSINSIDFEKDILPLKDRSADTVILCNVLEHVYNYAHLLDETRRILKEGGQLIGCVPFQHQYHPDPHDFFRYSSEALQKMFVIAGFESVSLTPLEGGPVMANFNNIVLSLPSMLRPIAFFWYRLWDTFFIFLRPNSVYRCPLGFVFIAR